MGASAVSADLPPGFVLDDQPAQQPPPPPNPSGAAIDYANELPAGFVADPRTQQVQQAYDALPAWQKPISAANDTVRLVTDGFSGGYADKGAAGLNSLFGLGPYVGLDDYQTALAKQRQETADAESRAGFAALPDEGLGMIAGPGKIADAVTGAAKSVPVLGNALVRAMGSGAVMGGFDAAGHDQDVGTGAELGAAGGAAGKVVGDVATKGIDEVAGLFNKAPPTVSAADVRSAASSLYKDPAIKSTIMSPDAGSRLAAAIRGRMADIGYTPNIMSAGGDILSELGNIEGQPATLAGWNNLRQVANNAASMDGPNRALGKAVTNEYDNFTRGLGPQDVLGGADPQAGINAVNQARSLWNRQSKLNDVEELMEKGEDRTAGANSGMNGQNTSMQNMRAVKWGRDDWTPDEMTALNQAVRGTPTSNTLRAAGNMMGGGLGSHGATNMVFGGIGGYEMGGVPGAIGGAALPFIGTGAKTLAKALQDRSVQNLQSVIANGGTQSAVSGAPNLVQQFARSHPDLLRQALTSAIIKSPGYLQPDQQ